MYRPAIVAILSLVLPSAPAVAQTPAIMDWFPTVFELCGFKQNADAPKVDGRNMTGVIADPKAASAHEVLHFAWARNWAVRRGDWKLIGTFDAKTNTMRHSLQNLAEATPQ